jgi:2-polyprenyl-3-methyl-5-hydroxy-6-metoxy-1,4-benzoquinol methylase
MSVSKWDKKYQQSEQAGEPCWLLKHFLHLLPGQGSSLDIACGLGANALCLAKQGLNSHGWDNSAIALEKLQHFSQQQALSITTLLRDVEQYPPEKNSFDIIVVSHFLYRPLFPQLVAALKPNGLIFYQTFHKNKASQSGPTNANFLLDSNELLREFAELEVVFYREDGLNGNIEKGLRECSYFIGRRKL